MKEAVTSTYTEVLRPKKHSHKEWSSAETLKKIKERRKRKGTVNRSRTSVSKARAQDKYAEANRNDKKSIKADKRDFVEKLAGVAKEAAHQGSHKKTVCKVQQARETSKGQSRKRHNRWRGTEEKDHRRSE